MWCWWAWCHASSTSPALYSACLQSTRNDHSNLEESHLRELHWPACVHPAETWVHLRADRSGDKTISSSLWSMGSTRVIPEGFKSAIGTLQWGISPTFWSDLDSFAHVIPSPSISLNASKKFPNTYAPWRPLPSVWQPGAEWNVSRQRMSTHKRQLWFRQTLRGGEGNIKAKVKYSLGSSAPRFT